MRFYVNNDAHNGVDWRGHAHQCAGNGSTISFEPNLLTILIFLYEKTFLLFIYFSYSSGSGFQKHGNKNENVFMIYAVSGSADGCVDGVA